MPFDKLVAASLEMSEWSHDVNTITENGAKTFSLLLTPVLPNDSE